jgi:hypothetical protein
VALLLVVRSERLAGLERNASLRRTAEVPEIHRWDIHVPDPFGPGELLAGEPDGSAPDIGVSSLWACGDDIAARIAQGC